MQQITISLPESTVERLDRMVEEDDFIANRSEAVRQVFRDSTTLNEQ